MACPDVGRYSTDALVATLENLDLWEALYCPYGAALGELTVGSVVYAGFALNIYIRTGSIMIPLILVLSLGGTVLAQVYAVISVFVGLIILIEGPLVISGLVFLIDRSG
jgi:hypothetical protein